ncbi:MAG: hypothetical protein AB7K09_07575 [Planctomycetota bacterium]
MTGHARGFDPDWSPPSDEHEKLGRMDRIWCGPLDDRRGPRLAADWLPFAPGSRFPLPEAATVADTDLADALRVSMPRVAPGSRLTEHWQPVASCIPPACLAGMVRPGAVSPDGRWVVTMDLGETDIRALPSGRRVRRGVRIDDMPNCYTPDARHLLVRYGGEVRLHELHTGVDDATPPIRTHTEDYVRAVDCSFDLVALACDGPGNQRIQINDLATARLVATVRFEGQPCRWLRFRRGGSELVAVFDGGFVVRVDPRSGHITHRMNDPGGRKRGPAVLTGDGRYLIRATGDRGLKILDIDTDTWRSIECEPLPGTRSTTPLTMLAAADGGRCVMVSNYEPGAGRSVANAILDARGDGRHGVITIDADGATGRVCWSAPGSVSAAGFPDRPWFLVGQGFETHANRVLNDDGTPISGDAPASPSPLSAVFTPDGACVISSGGLLHSATDGSVQFDFGCRGEGVAVSADGRFAVISCVAGRYSGYVRIGLTEPQRRVAQDDIVHRSDEDFGGTSAAISPDGRVAALGCLLVDLTRPDEPAQRIETDVFPVRAWFSPDGRSLALNQQSRIDMVDVPTCSVRWSKRSGRDVIRMARFSDNGVHLITGHESGRVRWTNTRTGAALRSASAPPEDALPGFQLVVPTGIGSSLWPVEISSDLQTLLIIEGMILCRRRPTS